MQGFRLGPQGRDPASRSNPGAFGSGGGFSPSGLKTAPGGPEASPTPGAAGGALASAYSSSGAGAGGAGSASGRQGPVFGSSLAGSGDPGAEGSGSDTVDFGGARSEVDAMAGEDPEDYFTRIGLGDSLFKRVEARYRDKSVRWAGQDYGPKAGRKGAVPIPPQL
jgi:hypothetical protein